MAVRIDGRTALITGASAGIGREIARELAPRLAGVVLVARRRERLEALATELRGVSPALRITVLECDLSDPSQALRMLADARAAEGRIDLLVNNAGIGGFGSFVTLDWSRIRRIIDLNVTALTLLTRELLPGMLERGRALVIPGLMMKLVMLLAAISPRPLLRLAFAPLGIWIRRRT